jgi:polar amino acid transport system substrate-binding protein
MTTPPARGGGDLDEIRGRGRLRLLTIPFHRVPDAYQVNSFDLEIVQRFVNAERLGLDEVLVASYDEVIPALVAGRGDVAAGGLTVTEERSRRVAFTVETFPSRMVIVTRKPRPPILEAERLAKERFGTERGTSCAEVTRSLAAPERIDDTIRIEDLPRALQEGRITAAVFELHVLLPAQRHDPELQAGIPIGPPGSLALAVRKECPALLAALNASIHTLRCGEQWPKLLVKYFGSATPEILRRSRE